MAGALATLEGALDAVERYGITEITRSKEWRTKLAEVGCIEVVDHADTVGYILSPEYAAEVVQTTAQLKQQLEQASLEAMFAAREGYTDLRSGQELADAALTCLEAKLTGNAEEDDSAR